MAVVDSRHSLLLTGQGDVLQPSDGVIGIGSGGPLACAAARALVRHSKLSALEIVQDALSIASANIRAEELECSN